MWGELGFDFELDVVDWGLHAEKRADLDFETFIVAWSGSIERLYPYYNLYHSFHSDFANPGGGNFMQWKLASEQYDNAVENFFQTQDREEGAQWAKYCQAIIAENVPMIPLTHPSSLGLNNTNLHSNWTNMPGPWPNWNLPTLSDLESAESADGTVIYANQPEFRGFPNVMAVNGAVDWYSHTFNYDTLVRLDTNGNPIPAAATEWEIQDDTTIDVTLRENLSFHDGEPVTPEDVKFTWDYMTEHGVPYLSSDLDPYDSSEILDDRTLRFNLSTPFGGFIQVSLYRVPILPMHVWDGITEEESIDHPANWSDPNTLGSGPFELTTYNVDSRIVWEANEDHYMSDEFSFDELIYSMYGDLTTAVGDVRNSNASMTDGLTPTLWNQASDDDHINQIEQEGIRTEGIWMNHTKEPWGDVNVRKALAYATNYSQLSEVVYNGLATNARSPISPVNEYYFNEDAKLYTQNLEQARSLLEESGFRWDDDGNLLKPTDWEPETRYISVENQWV
jgi:peptide/nickel transport system substrate-binding protein